MRDTPFPVLVIFFEKPLPEICYLIFLTNKEIACRLNISHNTSRNIRSKLFEKFKVNNVVELLNVAV